MTPFRTRSFAGVTLVDEDFHGQSLVGADFSDSRLVRCRLDGAALDGASLRAAQLHDCDLRAASWTGVVVDQTVFMGCLFGELSLRRAAPRVDGPYAVVKPRLELHPNGMRIPAPSDAVEIAFMLGGRERLAATERWTSGVDCEATLLHMSIHWCVIGHGPHDLSSGGAQAFTEFLRDGPPHFLAPPADVVARLRALVEARLPRWLPPLPTRP